MVSGLISVLLCPRLYILFGYLKTKLKQKKYCQLHVIYYYNSMLYIS